MVWRLLFLILACLPPAIPSARAQELAPADVEFFESRVRPILVERCYSCHSDQAEKVRGNLRLDTRAALLKGGDIGPALEPGNPDDSLLVQAVRWDDDSLKMPPKGKLPDSEIATLTDWVARGASDPRTEVSTPTTAAKPRTIDYKAGKQHWSFQPLRVEAPPRSTTSGWPITPIDHFILARLKEKGLEPSPSADRPTLIRRLYFDVTGLPPTPQEVDAFVNDPDPQAYEKLVDHALASPHFGERWARHWLDLARFGESHGFEHDYDRPSAYHYRDFLIEALNRDLPYDQFVSWQLAGDELAPDDPLAMKATGFLAAGVHSTQITASQAEKERYDELDDMAATTGTAFLGLTIGCARCHDHKYDPIAMADYYKIVATFTTTVRSEVDLDLDPTGYQEAKTAYDTAHAPYLQALASYEQSELPAQLASWEEAQASDSLATLTPWLVLDLVETKSAGGATFTPQPDGSTLLSGNNPQHETLTFTAHTDKTGITAIRLEALADPSLVKGGPGRASNGNFALSDFKLTVAPRSNPADKTPITLVNPRASFEQTGLPVAAAIDEDGTSSWAVDPQFGKDHAASFEADTPFGHEGGSILTFTLKFTNNLNHGLGRPRLALTTATTPESIPLNAPSIPQATLAILETQPEARTPAQIDALLAWYRTIDPQWLELKTAEAAHAAQAPRPSVVKALVSTEGLPAVRLHTQGPDFYEQTYMLRRGDPSQKVELVTAGFLPVLMASADSASNWIQTPPAGARTSLRRASLAAWMTDTQAGAGTLLARVAVNRLWQHSFGRGLVATPSDFGAQGEPPTHPELLDYLATELVHGGWHSKTVLRQILTSATYRQTSHIDDARAQLDIDNTLHWRQNRRRLEAEVIRDAMLAVSGQLDDSLLGPGTLDENMRRRSLYFTVKRSRLIPMMSQFDAPDALVPIAVRSTTTVAPQALLLLNSPIVRKWTVALAQTTTAEAGPDPAAQVTLAYRKTLGRTPDPTELEAALQFLAQQAQARHSEENAPTAALADFCQVLLASNEFVFVE